ncbi:hypothetical protein D9757_002626 [Collybiopsis confluens]|uniref:Yeast cell wall synthesis Kre9/Knh1-like N-terminal domain-containing protein n=1 Tax=Collybiopsis confluens TaxID=2823264 RepID=A0A8H5MEA9_9AGAR|nr:hypothetical protein D9757_002626 [Collybiopsis confluens]
MLNLKRKRELVDLDDDDEPSFGKQILPVANLPGDYDGIPADGMQYLFTVRRDARLLPQVTRVPNPYQTPESVAPPPRPVETTHPSLPSAEWRSLFEIRFRNLRKNIIQRTGTSASISLPEIKDRTAWWEFLAGKPESVWNPPKKQKDLKQKKYGRGMRAFADDSQTALDYEVEPSSEKGLESLSPLYKPITPTPTLLSQLNDQMALHILMYFTYWINQHLSQDRQPPFPRLSETHFQWVFALLCRVDDFVSADDMNLLRNLTRACMALLKVMTGERASQADRVPELLGQETACWMIISVVTGFWGSETFGWTLPKQDFNIEAVCRTARGRCRRDEFNASTPLLSFSSIKTPTFVSERPSKILNMRSAVALCFAFAASACAYSVTFPTSTEGWTNSGAQTLTWQRVSTDQQNFTAVLVNVNDSSESQVLAAQVDGTLGNTTLNPPSGGWPSPGDGYRVNLVQNTTELNAILAQSPVFSIKQSNTTSTSSSTATVILSTGTGTGTGSGPTSPAAGSSTDSAGSTQFTGSSNNNGAVSLGAQTGLFAVLALVGAILA